MNVSPEPLALLMDAVADMRHHQREYFRTRSLTALGAAKRAERKVDLLLAEFNRPDLFTPQTPKDVSPEPLALLMDAVADMRHHQREYFRTRSLTALGAAYHAERKVDLLLAVFNRRPDLFTPQTPKDA